VASFEFSVAYEPGIAHLHISPIAQVRAFSVEACIAPLKKVDRWKVEVWVPVHVFPAVVFTEMLHQRRAAIVGELAVEDEACPAVAVFLEQEFHTRDRPYVLAREDVAAVIFIVIPGINDNQNVMIRAVCITHELPERLRNNRRKGILIRRLR
jgi:hypothetical protein